MEVGDFASFFLPPSRVAFRRQCSAGDEQIRHETFTGCPRYLGIEGILCIFHLHFLVQEGACVLLLATAGQTDQCSPRFGGTGDTSVTLFIDTPIA